MSTNIQETVDRLRELDRYASPAPWSYLILPVDLHTGIQDSVLLDGAGLEFSTNAEDAFTRNDFDVILEARNAIPALLAEIERLTAENTQLLDTVAEAWDEGYMDKETEAPEEMIHLEPRERAENPYKEDN